MKEYSVVEITLIEAAHLLHPLRTLNTSGEVLLFLKQLGYAVPAAADLANTFTQVLSKTDKVIQDAIKLIQADTDDKKLQALTPLLLSVTAVIAEIANIKAALEAASGLAQDFINKAPLDKLPIRLLDYLLYQNLYRRYPKFFGTFHLLGILEEETLAENKEIYQPDGRLKVVCWERIPRYFTEPGKVIDEIYTWNTDFDSDELFARFSIFMRAMALAGGIYRQSENVKTALGNTTANLSEFRIPFFASGIYPDAYAQFGLNLTPAEAVDGKKKGLAFIPYLDGTATFDFQFSENWEALLQSSLNVDAGVGLILRPPLEIEFLQNLLTNPQNAGSFGLALTVQQRKDAGGQTKAFYLFGAQATTHLSISEISAKFFGNLNSPGDDVGLELEVNKINLLVTTGEGDSFISKTLPSSGVKAGFSLGIGFSIARALYFKGSAAIEVFLPTHIQLGPVVIQGITVAVRLKDDTIPVEVSAIIKAELGPFTAVVENIGLTSTFFFPRDRNGRIGPVDFRLGFKPPNGLGMSIKAKAVTGGGYLFFDHEKGQYAGILNLSVQDKFNLTIIGLLTTRLPDGRPGFSLLLIITVEFPPIQLGYGFVLTGVGGLIGIHRTMAVDALRAGVKGGGLNAILFPKNPIENATKLISDLKSFFPPAEGRFTFGPMAQIAWGGAYPLLTVELGILIELPWPLRVALLGRITLALPKREKPDDEVVVAIQMDILGIIDFEKSDLSIDATLFDSRILIFPLSGDMALRFNWGANPDFALSAGGFHPAYVPPPAFPQLGRLALDLSFEDYVRIRAETYLAVTTAAAMMGARVEVFAGWSAFSAEAHLSFDALVRFKPFSFVVDMAADATLRLNGTILFAIAFSLTLSGPQPMELHGYARFDFFGRHEFPFAVTFGQPPAGEEPVVIARPIDDLLAEVKKSVNWSGQLPAAGQAIVSLREMSREEGVVLAHPLGRLTFRQQTVPLNTPISRYGEAQIDGPRRFELAFSIGNSPSQGQALVSDNFAPGMFSELSDDAKLSEPAFVALPSGYENIGQADAVADFGESLSRTFGYEETIIDNLEQRLKTDKKDNPVYFMAGETLIAAALLGAAAASPLRETGATAFAGPVDQRVALADPLYVVAGVDTLAADGSPASHYEAKVARQEKGETAREWQVVGRHEMK